MLRLEALEVSGNWKTRESVLHRLAALSPGDPLDPSALDALRDRLLASGYFHEVQIDTRPGAERGSVIVALRVVERHRPYLDTGFGFRDPEGWYLTLLGLRSENPFGLGGWLRAGAQLGFRNIGADAELSLPRTRNLELRLRLRTVEEQLLWYENEPGWLGLYDEHRLALRRQQASLSMIWRAEAGLRLELGLVALSAEPAETARNRELDTDLPAYDLPERFRAEAGAESLHGLLLGLRLGEGGMDGRPGRSLHLRGRLVSGALGADRDYARLTLALRTTWALPARQGLALGLRGGLVGSQAPYYDRFRLGGSYSLRGFRDHSLSPPEGHDAFVAIATEYRFPLLDDEGDDSRLSGLLFLDAGRGWLTQETSSAQPDVDYERLQLGAGYGLRLRLPWLGIVGFDVGLPVSSGVTGEAVWYYLTLGHSF